jgi:hypothetical protein
MSISFCLGFCLKVFRKNYCNYIPTNCLLSTTIFQKYSFVQTLFLAFINFGVKFEDGLHCVSGTCNNSHLKVVMCVKYV